MDIKVGEYCRTDKGYIFKVDEEKKKLSIVDFLDVEYGKIKSHSENLIDLIEVGDIVNGKRVYRIDKKFVYVERDNETSYERFGQNQIKTILTHEQYEQNCYKVEE